ncbi:MAG TPA: hypothetical protein PLT28_00430 [Saprospiraceae bacterium]|nr:hypothetical protein [Saprospiraceae bacterium]
MAVQTYSDEIIDFKQNVLNTLKHSQVILGLLADNPTIDVDSEEAYAIQDNNFYDFDYADSTITRSDAFIMVDVDIIAEPSPSIKDLEIYVQVVCHKQFMLLDATKFKGIKGNRKDNLSRQIDFLLNGSRDYGIGKLNLMDMRTVNVPKPFTSKLLSYEIPGFLRIRSEK